jgi:hypothetical protein
MTDRSSSTASERRPGLAPPPSECRHPASSNSVPVQQIVRQGHMALLLSSNAQGPGLGKYQSRL